MDMVLRYEAIKFHFKNAVKVKNRKVSILLSSVILFGYRNVWMKNCGAREKMQFVNYTFLTFIILTNLGRYLIVFVFYE